jgi:transposase
MRTVAIKSEAQQAILSLHRIRSALVDTRTRQVNQIRGLLGEYGLHFRYGRKALMNELPGGQFSCSSVPCAST